jgi:predicted DNA-binding transcriptional regulator YafY
MSARKLRTKQKAGKTLPRSSNTRRERQIVRILALLRVLAAEPTFTVQQLADRFGTRREAIYRDLHALEDAGYPIAGDEQGRLSRPRMLPQGVPDIRLSPPELEALLLSTRQTQAALPDSDSLTAATFKLKALAESSPGAAALTLSEKVETWTCGSKDHRPYEDYIVVLIEAILRKRRCRVAYQKPSQAEPKRYDFDPYSLLVVGGGLYVVGNVPKHTGTAMLSIDRLTAVALSDTEFEVDPNFDLRTCRENAFGSPGRSR